MTVPFQNHLADDVAMVISLVNCNLSCFAIERKYAQNAVFLSVYIRYTILHIRITVIIIPM